ncbi:hypothetical protein CO652_15030 [Rhizobium sp. H4]|nr:hypothetical protein CO652_15030 [Rhizobium sp. H4]
MENSSLWFTRIVVSPPLTRVSSTMLPPFPRTPKLSTSFQPQTGKRARPCLVRIWLRSTPYNRRDEAIGQQIYLRDRREVGDDDGRRAWACLSL